MNERGKPWFDALPNADPIAKYDVMEGGAIVVYVLFDPPLPRFIKSACHARRSWLMHSDAKTRGTPIRFYVEEGPGKDASLPIFEENGVDVDSDIIWWRDIPAKPDTNLRDNHRRKVSFLTDPYFKDYKWTLLSDADVFLSAGQQWNGTKLPVFKTLLEREERGYGVVFTSNMGTALDHWVDKLFSFDTTAENRKHLAGILAEMVSPDDLKKIPETIRLVHAGVSFFPSKKFMTSQAADCKWIHDVGQQTDSHELALSLWWELGGEVWGWRDEYQTDCVFIEQNDAYATHSIYFTHPHNQVKQSPEEAGWRKSIGLE